MTTLLTGAIVGFVIATLICPWVDSRRRHRRVRMTSCERIVPAQRRPLADTDGPDWTRDPSPRRRPTDYEWRAIANGMEKT